MKREVLGSSDDPDNNDNSSNDDNVNVMEINIKSASESQLLCEAKMSVVTFDEPSLLEEKESKAVEDLACVSLDETETQPSTPGSSPSRKIQKRDVAQIFRASVTTGRVSREQVIRIKKMHEKISDGVDFNFNYATLLLIAIIVAGVGLTTDSSTTVVSSMLLSPIMGPVIGMSYGLIIWDLPLIKRSVRNEMVSILICIVLGIIIGLATFWTPMAELSWPTVEMYNRCTRQSFLAGIPTAFFSGMGVALSVLDDQTSSLVGVAISASLLPPAVNSGILLIIAIVDHESWNDFEFEPYHFFRSYRKDATPNFSNMAITSLALTVANILFVSIGALLMFRIKEVLPVKKKVFWDDLKIARRIYTGRAHNEEGEVLTTRQADEIVRNRM